MNCHRLLVTVVTLAVCLAQPAFLLCQKDSSKDSSETQKVCRIGRGVTPPRLIYQVNPSYDDASRKAKLRGSVVLTLIIAPDGKPKDIRVTRSLSPGLDQKAVEAVSQWKFAPATKDGNPVAVEINVETTFKLY